ncbi:hypothetical protein P43SY_006759 [Pythium insidiosum]|uniref:AB hydrolase-1 domain-containing protein n=1 Tax=Pythium insidiosum TaxID=114742 RepID=A0AAD5LQJ3_PYTIN|nr:hypothetical protein P43SY_006759 [Pythium insidiosum]
MKLRSTLLYLLFTLSSAAAASAELLRWHPCALTTLETHAARLPTPNRSVARGVERSADTAAECAMYSVPLCHDGVCRDEQNRSLEVFVKRLPAKDRSSRNNVFMLQGGPGLASAALELVMQSLYDQLDGAFNVYTLDHRGTGRSNILDCVAAQAETSGSPMGRDVSAVEAASCASDLARHYGSDLSSFSVTSAAKDVEMIITREPAGSSTFVYGLSYGTAWAERLMQLQVPEIKGYVLDGICTTAGADASKFEFWSLWDYNYNEAGERFLALCDENVNDCGRYFSGSSARLTLVELLHKLDDTTFACSQLLQERIDDGSLSFYGLVKPSHVFRAMLGELLDSLDRRSLIPVLTYRLHRCTNDDMKVFSHFVENWGDSEDDDNDISMRKSYKGGFIAFLVLFIVATLAAGVFLFKWRRAKRESASSSVQAYQAADGEV